MRKEVQIFPSTGCIHLPASSAAADLLTDLHRINTALPCRSDLAWLLKSHQFLKTLPLLITPTYSDILHSSLPAGSQANKEG